MMVPLLAAAAIVVSTPASSQSSNYSIVALPDTQFYTTTPELFEIMLDQIDWILDHIVTDEIVFTAHVGDIVQNGAVGAANNQEEWERAFEALNRLEGGRPSLGLASIPYSVAIGNRDYDVISSKTQGSSRFMEFFGEDRYLDEPWYLGSSGNELLHAQRFSTPAGDWLHITLDWQPSDMSLLYAQEEINRNPGIPVIITTHEFLSSGVNAPWRSQGNTQNDTGNNNPEQTYRKLLEPNPAITLLFCGHISGGGYRTDTTIFGRDVHQVLCDFQGDPQGGNGWLVLAEFDDALAQIRFRTVSPTYIPGVTSGPDRSLDPRSNFERDYDAVAHRGELEETLTLHFRNGVEDHLGENWNGAVDTYIGNGGPGGTPPGETRDIEEDVFVDGTGSQEQGLLAFTGLIGPGSAQVPPNATIRKAILTLTTEGANAQSQTGARLHRMLVPWTGSDTWISLGAGVQLGSECETFPDVTVGSEIATNGTRSFDVTAAVQAWSDGVPNYGWAIFGDGDDMWTFRSSDWRGIMERPQLTVQYDVDCQPPATFCVTESNSTGAPGKLGFVGSQSIATLDMSLRADNLPPLAPTLLIGGLSRTARVVGDGRICVGGPSLMRFGPLTTADLGGTAALSVAPSLAALLPRISERWHFQAWHRDSSPIGSNLTNALDVLLCD